MKRIFLCVLTAALLVLTACQASETPPQETVTASAAAVESQPEEIGELMAEDTIRHWFEYFNNRDADAINALMKKGLKMELTEESATLALKDCTELRSDEETAVVEVNFDVEIDERNMTSFEEGRYTWRFYLIKDTEGMWCIDDYGM